MKKIEGFTKKAVKSGNKVETTKLMRLDAFLKNALNYEKLVETLERDNFAKQEKIELEIKSIFTHLYADAEL